MLLISCVSRKDLSYNPKGRANSHQGILESDLRLQLFGVICNNVSLRTRSLGPLFRCCFIMNAHGNGRYTIGEGKTDEGTTTTATDCNSSFDSSSRRKKSGGLKEKLAADNNSSNFELSGSQHSGQSSVVSGMSKMDGSSRRSGGKSKQRVRVVRSSSGDCSVASSSSLLQELSKHGGRKRMTKQELEELGVTVRSSTSSRSKLSSTPEGEERSKSRGRSSHGGERSSGRSKSSHRRRSNDDEYEMEEPSRHKEMRSKSRGASDRNRTPGRRKSMGNHRSDDDGDGRRDRDRTRTPSRRKSMGVNRSYDEGDDRRDRDRTSTPSRRKSMGNHLSEGSPIKKESSRGKTPKRRASLGPNQHPSGGEQRSRSRARERPTVGQNRTTHERSINLHSPVKQQERGRSTHVRSSLSEFVSPPSRGRSPRRGLTPEQLAAVTGTISLPHGTAAERARSRSRQPTQRDRSNEVAPESVLEIHTEKPVPAAIRVEKEEPERGDILAAPSGSFHEDDAVVKSPDLSSPSKKKTPLVKKVFSKVGQIVKGPGASTHKRSLVNESPTKEKEKEKEKEEEEEEEEDYTDSDEEDLPPIPMQIMVDPEELQEQIQTLPSTDDAPIISGNSDEMYQKIKQAGITQEQFRKLTQAGLTIAEG